MVTIYLMKILDLRPAFEDTSVTLWKASLKRFKRQLLHIEKPQKQIYYSEG